MSKRAVGIGLSVDEVFDAERAHRTEHIRRAGSEHAPVVIDEDEAVAVVHAARRA